MEEVIALNNIQLHQKATDWQQAIQIAGSSLVSSGSVLQKYVDNMIASVKELGPYIVIMPNFALAHAAPCEEVLKNDLSIAVFDNDIHFGCDNDPVRVVMCLASTDGKSHIDKLSKIAQKLMNEDENLIDKLMKAQSKQEIFEILNSK